MGKPVVLEEVKRPSSHDAGIIRHALGIRLLVRRRARWAHPNGALEDFLVATSGTMVAKEGVGSEKHILVQVPDLANVALSPFERCSGENG